MKTNALQLRQSLGKILKKLAASKEPIIIEKNREPVAVLISYKTFKERFIDYQEQKKIKELLQAFEDELTPAAVSSLEVLRELRYGARG